ncbi:hypothetical protein GCM10011517_10500 [Actibacterium pelagium]|uniref:DUF1499 domain-containing protein n=2 Tax=Actibacterium pelagium TaxID=2029103 RepID=A0A917EI02_9RHOB|nr:hypothetical protein GCM10011517_10500 [Actibacterium pelagium]
MVYLLVGLCVAVIGLMGWVRLAPHDVERFHTEVRAENQTTFDVKKIGALAVTDAYPQSPQVVMQRFVDIALNSPRTKVLAGSVESGRITLVTRTLFWGFADYSTIESVHSPEGTRLKIFARMRWNGSDWGVNAKRLKGWLKTFTDV